MKILRFCCPFRGKKYPFIAAVVLALIAYTASIQADFSDGTATAATVFAAAAALLISFLIENIPSDEERAFITSAAAPEWQSAPENLRKKVCERTKLPGRAACMTTFGCFLLMLMFLNLFKEKESGSTLAVCAFLAGAGIMLTDFLLRMRFRITIDDSALCAVIPVDSVYDFETTSRVSRRLFGPNNTMHHYSSYLVFYLPDGRYTLPIPSTKGRFNAVAVVKNRGMLRWTPVYQDETGIKPV